MSNKNVYEVMVTMTRFASVYVRADNESEAYKLTTEWFQNNCGSVVGDYVQERDDMYTDMSDWKPAGEDYVWQVDDEDTDDIKVEILEDE